MNYMPRCFRSTYKLILILVIFTILVTACGSPATEPVSSATEPVSPATEPVSTPPPASSVSMKAIAEDIAKDVGKVIQVNDGSPSIVIVFEETHDSTAGQTEIAIMMNRLYENYGMKQIALEGYFKESGKLDATWFQKLPPFIAKQSIREREDVIVQLLQSGEISSSEAMALTYNDMVVTGIETPEEYNYEPPDGAWNAPIFYLYQIASPGMTTNEIDTANGLIQEDKILEALEFIIDTDEWTSKEYELIYDDTQIISAEGWLDILDEIEEKAVGLDISVEDKQAMDGLREFYETASQRSRTMVDNTLEISNLSPNVPVAMIIGAAHTELIVDLLTENGNSFAIIRGNALDKGLENGNLSYAAYDRKTQQLSVGLPGSLGALLDGRKKPQPVINKVWLQSELQTYHLTDILAKAARSGQLPPFDDELNNLPELKGITLNRSSITIKDGDVIFSVDVLNDNGEEVTVWVRARTDKDAVDKFLEDRLQEALKEIQSSEEPSTDEEKTSSEPELMAISSQTIAKFSTDKSLIESIDI